MSGTFRLFGVRAALSLALVALSSQIARALPPDPWNGMNLVWSDEFNLNYLNPYKWDHYRLGEQVYEATNVANAVSFSGGNMLISTYTQGGTHFTGAITSRYDYQFTYGCIEARIKFVTNSGVNSAIWMRSDTFNDPGAPEDVGTEIDIVEHRFHNEYDQNIKDVVHNCVCWGGYGPGTQIRWHDTYKPGLYNAYHKFTLLWTPTSNSFYYDNQLTWTFTEAISQTDEYILFTSLVNNGWQGTIPPGGYGPLGDYNNSKMYVDYVRVYQEGGGMESKIIPEPSGIVLLISALVGLLCYAWRRRRGA